MGVVAAVVALSACSGTIKPDTRVQGDASRVFGVAQVTAVMSSDAMKQLADSPQFDRDELASFMRRRLEGRGLLASGATHRVEIVVTDLRVRGVFAAVMFGVMAGDDHVAGRVRILDENNRPIRSFDVQASYALGGWGGGQDSMRMNWLYDKFSELSLAELEKVVRAPGSAETTDPNAPIAAAPARSAEMVAARPRSGADNGAANAGNGREAVAARAGVERVDAVPGLNDHGRDVYRDWLSRRSPRAFVIADDGKVNATWGRKPKDPLDPADPAERAMKQCRTAGRTGCALYAVDDRVVYVPAPAPETSSP